MNTPTGALRGRFSMASRTGEAAGFASDGRLFHDGKWAGGAAVKINGKGRILPSLR